MAFFSELPPSYEEPSNSMLELFSSQPPFHPDNTLSQHDHNVFPSQKPLVFDHLRKKIIFDRVYGEMVFPPVLSVFIDSPVVQRLRGLKQLGMTDYVYPGATHTRFEHSLGVSHLAMEFLRQIWLNHNRTGGFSSYPLPPEVELDRVRAILSERETPYSEADVREWVEKEYERDVWCLGIAGLCHDLGHGPLSHMFEDFIKQLERQGKVKDGFQHEWMSAQLLEMIWKKNENVLDQFGFDTRDLFFIRLLIEGLPPDVPFDEEATGRPRWKRFMTEIVANKRNGLDVDKLDYLQRDSLSTQGTLALPSLNRLFQAACAAHDDQGMWQICYVEKVDDTMEEVFLARARLHRRVYQHRVTLVMSCMMCDVFLAAEPYFKVHHNGKEYTLSEVSKVPEAFVEVADWVVDAIQHSAEPKLHLAQNIIRRIKSRQIYQTVAFYGVSSTKKSPAVQVPPATTVIDTTSTQGSSTPVKKERRPDDGGSEITVDKLYRALQRVDHDLYTTLVNWEKDMERQLGHTHRALELLTGHISQTPGDIRSDNPLDVTLYINPRKPDDVPFHRSAPATSSSGVRPYKIIVFVTRRRCSQAERDTLGLVFRQLANESGVVPAGDHSATPRRLLSQHLSQRSKPEDTDEEFGQLPPPPSVLLGANDGEQEELFSTPGKGAMKRPRTE